MNRREMIELSGFVLAASQFPFSSANAAENKPVELLQFDTPLAKEELMKLEKEMSGSGILASTRPKANVVVPVYFDETTQAFTKAREVKATLDSKPYSLNVALRGSRISQDALNNLKDNNLQVNFNVGVPTGRDPQDLVSWLIMSGIDVFGDKSKQASNLIQFQKGSSLTGVFDAGQGITVDKGRLTMGIELYGHKKASWWETILKIVKKGVDAPFFGQLGLPMLAKQALQFATSALNKITQTDELIPLLQSPPLAYTVQKDLNAPVDRYKLKEGLWVAVDLAKAETTDYLKNYDIDLDSPLFPVREKNTKQPLEADYMVVEFTFTQKT